MLVRLSATSCGGAACGGGASGRSGRGRRRRRGREQRLDTLRAQQHFDAHAIGKLQTGIMYQQTPLQRSL